MSRLFLPLLLLAACADEEGASLAAELAPSLPLGLDLLSPTWVSRGSTIDLEVVGASPGDTVAFVAGGPPSVDASCPPALPDCLDVPGAQLLGTATAGPTGDAVLTTTIPTGATYRRGALQAVAWPPGQVAQAVASPAQSLLLVPPGCTNDVTVSITTVQWAQEIGFAVGTTSSSVAILEQPGILPTNGMTFAFDVTLAAGRHNFLAIDSFGDGWHNGWAEIVDASGNVLLTFAPGVLGFTYERRPFDVPCGP